MKRVLVTRPAHQASLLADALCTRGFDALIAPMLVIAPLVSLLPNGQARAVLCTSANAFSDYSRKALIPFLHLPCFCVGPATTEAARATGFHTVHTGDTDGTGLAKRLIAEGIPGPFLYPSAAGPVGPAASLLTASGQTVLFWPTYRSDPIHALDPDTKESLTQKKLHSALFFSPRTARIFVEVLNQAGMKETTQPLCAVALSEAVAKELRSVSWARLDIAQEPTQNGILNCLEAL